MASAGDTRWQALCRSVLVALVLGASTGFVIYSPLPVVIRDLPPSTRSSTKYLARRQHELTMEPEEALS